MKLFFVFILGLAAGAGAMYLLPQLLDRAAMHLEMRADHSALKEGQQDLGMQHAVLAGQHTSITGQISRVEGKIDRIYSLLNRYANPDTRSENHE